MTTGFKPCIHRSSGNPDHAICHAGEPAPMRVTPVTCAPCRFREEPKPTKNCDNCIDSATIGEPCDSCKGSNNHWRPKLTINFELEKKMDDIFEPLDHVKCPHCNADRHGIVILYCRVCGKVVGFGEGDRPGFREKYKHRRMVKMYLNKPPKIEGCNCDELSPKPIPPWGNGAKKLMRARPGVSWWGRCQGDHLRNNECTEIPECVQVGFRDIRKVQCPLAGKKCSGDPCDHHHSGSHARTPDCAGFPRFNCPACVPIGNEGEKKE